MTIHTSNWSAWVNSMPMSGKSLHVIGTVEIANEGQHAILRAAEPQGIVGTHKLLELLIVQQPGNWPAKPGLTSQAHYYESLAGGTNPYTAIDVIYNNESVANIENIGQAF